MAKTSRRDKGEGSLYRRKDGMWCGTVELPLGEDGKRRRKVVASKDYAKAAAKLRTLRREVEDHGDVLSQVPTVTAWLTHWLDDIAPERTRQRTRDGYRGYITNYLTPALGHRRLDQLRAEHVRSMLRGMADKGLSEATRRQAFAILHRALKVAVREGKVRVNVCTLMDPPKVPTTHGSPFSLDVVQQILAYLDVERDAAEAARWQLALLAGLRQGEALGLRWEDVDLQRRVVWVRQAGQRQKGRGMVVVDPKSETSVRVVPLLPQVVTALALMPPGDGLIFPGPSGGLRGDRVDWGAWKAMLVKAGVAHRSLRSARTTFGTLLSAAGSADKLVSEVMGHAQVAVTQKHYIMPDEARHVEAVAALGRLIES